MSPVSGGPAVRTLIEIFQLATAVVSFVGAVAHTTRRVRRRRAGRPRR